MIQLSVDRARAKAVAKLDPAWEREYMSLWGPLSTDFEFGKLYEEWLLSPDSKATKTRSRAKSRVKRLAAAFRQEAKRRGALGLLPGIGGGNPYMTARLTHLRPSVELDAFARKRQPAFDLDMSRSPIFIEVTAPSVPAAQARATLTLLIESYVRCDDLP